MKRLTFGAVAVIAACAKSPEFTAAGWETRNFARWWCPSSGEVCNPEVREPPKGVQGNELRLYLERSAKFAAAACDRKVRTGFPGAQCVSTRLVVCSTHDPDGANVCFVSWEMCRRSLKGHPDRSCAAYFDGERIE